MGKFPTIKFNNGKEIPVLGLGTWKSKPGEVTQAVKDAIDLGYRHIDCAYIYGNEKEVGVALKAKIAEGVVKREELFITSKLWNTFHRTDLVEKVLRETLSNLELEYLDLYLIHWPVGYKEGENLFPRDASDKVITSDVDYVDTWKEMEKCLEKGLTQSIGVSNFNIEQLDRLLANSKVTPVNNQIECHPYLNQKKLMDHCASKGIKITAYSPLGSPDRPWAKPEDPQLLDDAKIKSMAEKYGKSPAQIVLRYQIERGNITIPKSVTKARIDQNANIFDFKLSKEDIEFLDTFDCEGRVCALGDAIGHKYYPF